MKLQLADAEATERLGGWLGQHSPAGLLIRLHGDLGAGKTTLVRGFLAARGHVGPVKSPTYTLVESYALAQGPVHHFDLYRLADPDELEYIGIAEFFEPGALCLVEWPERGEGVLPVGDVRVWLRHVPAGREAELVADSAPGEDLLRAVAGEARDRRGRQT